MAEPAVKRAKDQSSGGDLTGQTVGRFEVKARLGSGGMGEVYRAWDTKLKRGVALKRIAPQLRADPRYRERLLREAELASRLTDPHIAGIYDVLEQGDDTYLVMEYVEGETLRQRLRRPLPLGEFQGMASQCAAALSAAHGHGVLHRDIKPENIILTAEGQIKMLDFGVARRLPRPEETSTIESRAGALAGTPAYMPPEALLEKEVDGRGDIFSLGVVFYEALSGRNPFRTDSFVMTCNRVLHEEPAALSTLNPLIPPEWERIVTKMLAKDPAARYPSATSLQAELRALEGEASAPTAPVVPRAEAAHGLGRKAGLLAGVVLLLGLAALPSVRQRALEWVGKNRVPAEKQLAVLPLTVVGNDAAGTAFGEGLRETLTAKLARLTASHNLQVISANEVATRRVRTAEQARKEFGATLSLEGSVHRSGDLVRINYALVDTRSGKQLRAESITAAAADPFAAQDQVVNGVVGMLDLALQPQEQQALEAHGTQVAGAYNFFLEGRGYLSNYDRPENIDSGIAAFQQALALDSNYALAYAGLGDAYWKKYQESKQAHWLEESRQACQQALRLDANLAAAHICMGTLAKGTGQYEQAAAEFNRALESEPTSDDSYRGLAEAYERLGMLAEAEKTYQRAIQVRPEYWAGYSWLGAFYYHQARYQDAARMFQKVVMLVPDSFRGYSNLGAAYLDDGRYAEAVPMFEHSLAIRPSAGAYSNLGTAYFFQHRFAEAGEKYEQASQMSPEDYLYWWNLGDARYWDATKHSQAAMAYRKAIALARGNLKVNSRDTAALGAVAICHAMLQEKTPALQVLQAALRLAPQDPDLLLKAAQVHQVLGQRKAVPADLSKALAAGISAAKVRADPIFESLHGNPAFEDLLRRTQPTPRR